MSLLLLTASCFWSCLSLGYLGLHDPKRLRAAHGNASSARGANETKRKFAWLIALLPLVTFIVLLHWVSVLIWLAVVLMFGWLLTLILSRRMPT